jgi:scyllo-inositol 2-dehydrogenase (NADP+)
MNTDPIGTGFASFGMSGLVFHGPFLRQHTGFRVVSILERSKNLSASMFPDISLSRTYDELLKNPEIELVIVNTPDQYHFEMAKAALLSGKHVIVEKPFTRTSVEA